jgi:hypothetical protein
MDGARDDYFMKQPPQVSSSAVAAGGEKRLFFSFQLDRTVLRIGEEVVTNGTLPLLAFWLPV